MYYNRILSIELPKKQSAFLWGARKTGKSTFLKQKFPNSIYFDFLKSDDFLKYSKQPHRIREEILLVSDQELENKVIIIDEVQKIPAILDEVHWLIENINARFILCGSSARKLKRSGVNLLGGRAWKYHFFPLIYEEIKDFSLLTMLNNGAIPSHYQSSNIKKSMKSYIEDYLIQEIQTEGLVRNLPAFARFMDIMAFSNGEIINYSNISRDCSVDAKTVKEYFTILFDTLLGYFVYPYSKRIKRDIIISQPKFYLFDVGIGTYLTKRYFNIIEGPEAGKALENYILQELVAYNAINELDYKITYWRTKTGLEVDFLIEDKVAIEVKISKNVHNSDLRGIKALNEELKLQCSYVVCQESTKRLIIHNDQKIVIIPIEEFLALLWKKKIF